MATTRPKIELRGTEQTLLLTLAMRDRDARSVDPVLGDRWATEIVERVDYPWWRLRAIVAGNQPLVIARARTIDDWVRTALATRPDSVVLHLGCGLDSRPLRIGVPDGVRWIDVDRPRVIKLRHELYGEELDGLETISAAIDSPLWSREIPADRPLLVVCEGLFMYLSPAEVESVFDRVSEASRTPTLIADSVSAPIRDATRLLPAALSMGARFRSTSADADRAVSRLPIAVHDEISLIDAGAQTAGRLMRPAISLYAAAPGAHGSFVLRRYAVAAG